MLPQDIICIIERSNRKQLQRSRMLLVEHFSEIPTLGTLFAVLSNKLANCFMQLEVFNYWKASSKFSISPSSCIQLFGWQVVLIEQELLTGFRHTFKNRVITRRCLFSGSVVAPLPKSYPEFLSLGHLKDRVYSLSPCITEELKVTLRTRQDISGGIWLTLSFRTLLGVSLLACNKTDGTFITKFDFSALIFSFFAVIIVLFI